MKKYTSCLGVMMVILLAACGTGLQPDVQDFSNTMLTGRVLQREADTITLNLGELAILQTPESAASVPLLPSDVTQSVRLTSHAAPDGQTLENEPKAFVSWQRDTVLDLSHAECFTVGKTGAIEATTPENIAPQDILNITMDANNIPATVFVLTGVSQSDADTESLQGTAANLIADNTDQNGGEYESQDADENALRVLSANITLHNVQINKVEGDGSDQEAADRYGKNAALLATGGAHLLFETGAVDSAAETGSGIFGHGNGTSVQLHNSTVTTTGDYAKGIQASGGAIIQAKKVTATTAGNASAVLWADNGSLEITGGTFTSGGYHSPAIFSSGMVEARNAELAANNSEAAVLQGPGMVMLENCNLGSNASGTDSIDPEKEIQTILIQGGNGPAQKDASFSMTGGSLSASRGTVFYVSDTDCTITLKNVTITDPDTSAFLHVIGTGENGPSVTLNAYRQTLEGDFITDSNSTLQLNLRKASSLQGAILLDDQAAAASGASVHIESGCLWSLTGNSVVNTLENEGTILFNGYTITLGDGTVLTS